MKKLFFLLAILCVAGPALASDAAAVSQTINAFFSTAGGLAGKQIYVEDGKTLFKLLLLILIAWTGIFSLFSDGGFLVLAALNFRTNLASTF